MKELLPFLKPYWKGTTAGFLCKLLEAFMELLLPFYMAQVIDKGIKQQNMEFIYQTGFKMLVCTLIGLIAVLICQYLASDITSKLSSDLRNALLDKISGFTYSEVDKFGTDTLTTRMTNDVNLVCNAVAMMIRLVSRAPFLAIGAIVMGCIVCPELAWSFLIIIPAFILVVGFIMKKSVPLFREVQIRLDHLGLLVRENLSGVRVIRALNRQDYEEKRVHTSTGELADAYVHVTDWTSWVNPFILFLLNVVAIAVLWVGGGYINDGILMQGDLTAFIEYIVQITAALVIIANLVTVFAKASASANRIAEVFTTEPAFSHGKIQTETVSKPVETALSFENVTFAYEGGNPVLDKISFTLKKGEVLGIIGPTGSGKSTLVGLIGHFYESTKGKITLFENPIEQYTRESIVDLVGIVPQKSILFSGTIAENMAYSKPNATKEEIWESLKTAQAADFVSEIPNQIDALVEQGGQNFSGGQRQRLCIARTLVKKAPILILDDSLSALDYQTDQKLRQALKEDQEEISLIIVSQRVSSVQNADQILVLEQGKIKGLGKHDELIKSCETYREIYETQTSLQGEEVIE